MAKNDINSKPYDEATTLKLDIFRKCFREWLPVFIYDPSVSNLYIYDMFAGSGHDSNGNMGSPLILLDEAKGKECRYCNFLSKNQNKKVIFGFNEKEYQKVEQLKKTKDAYLAECRENCEHDECVYYKNIHCQSQTFDQILQNSRFNDILKSKSYAKFILLDQYGFSQITDDVFLKLFFKHCFNDAPKDIEVYSMDRETVCQSYIEANNLSKAQKKRLGRNDFKIYTNEGIYIVESKILDPDISKCQFSAIRKKTRGNHHDLTGKRNKRTFPARIGLRTGRSRL